MAGLGRIYVYWGHFLFVGPLLAYVGIKGDKTPRMVFALLLILGLVVMAYHMYNVIMFYKKEGFLRNNNYNWQTEGFVPLSYPYTCESDAYYSYHDTVNKRGCKCELSGGEGTCAAQTLPSDAVNTAVSLTVKPAEHNKNPIPAADYGMHTLAPVMGRNPVSRDYLL